MAGGWHVLPGAISSSARNIVDPARVSRLLSARNSVPASAPPRAGQVLPGLIVGFVVLCAIERLVAATIEGFTVDEAYTTVIARSLQLSYFDHPPLHQWILHGAVALFGEGRLTRLPFLIAIEAINLPLYWLTRRLYDSAAGLWALFAFNAAVYFMIWPDGLIVPDAPLLLFLALAVWLLAEILFGPRAGGLRSIALWLGVGLAFGLAGLSKYSAAFSGLGVIAFLVGSPGHRFWLGRVEPYLGGALALAVFSPALIWNGEHHWVSFAFQSGRAGQHFSLDVPAAIAIASGLAMQFAAISPWVAIPLVAALVTAARQGDAGSADRLLLWLVAPTVIFFALLPLVGERAIPHWFNSGWLFAFPLLGRWLSGRPSLELRRWAVASAALTVIATALFVAFVVIGPPWQTVFKSGPQHLREPTELSYDWRGLAAASAWRASGASPPAFILVDDWKIGGKAGLAIGPGVPVCDDAPDAREFAFECDWQSRLGEDALIVVPEGGASRLLAATAPYFERIDAIEKTALGPPGYAEQPVTLARGYNLLRPFVLPYGIGR